MSRSFPTNCPRCAHSRLRRHGSFYRTSDSKLIRRFRCARCAGTFSRATFDPWFKQIKRKANDAVFRLLCSGVSLRRTARLLRLHRTTVVRKFRFLAEEARRGHEEYLKELERAPLVEIFFDEMETFEHTKFKPLSIALAVSRDRRILSAEVARMPAKGLLAAKSVEKYGYRKDERPRALGRMLATLKPIAAPHATFHSDQNPSYPSPLMKTFPGCVHVTTKGGRSCVVGQGELKKLTWDPLFSLNHTAAMFRANMNRLFRRTWCTTKIPQGLRDHLALYTRYHNEVLLAQ